MCAGVLYGERERERERKRMGEKENGRERNREGERETGRGRERNREREGEKQGEGERVREIFRICPELFIFKRNDRCLGTCLAPFSYLLDYIIVERNLFSRNWRVSVEK
jgi:hypothetical protein